MMHKATKHPIELQRVTFADVTITLDFLAQYTRLVSQPIDSTLTSTTPTDTPQRVDIVMCEITDVVTIKLHIKMELIVPYRLCYCIL